MTLTELQEILGERIRIANDDTRSLEDRKLKPYAQHIRDGLFELKECFNEKSAWKGTQVLVTPKGRETFRMLCI